MSLEAEPINEGIDRNWNMIWKLSVPHRWFYHFSVWIFRHAIFTTKATCGDDYPESLEEPKLQVLGESW